ncbi:hypothetical protein ACFS07_26705 [Undibacterium arcticum]
MAALENHIDDLITGSPEIREMPEAVTALRAYQLYTAAAHS